MEHNRHETEDYVPVEKYDKNITSHDYDGIRELDNPAPNWVLFVFLITIFFALVYAIHYFGFPGNNRSQAKEYVQSVNDFTNELQAKKSASQGGGALTEVQIIAEGKKLYNEKGCIACHGQQGEGNAVGPNLTDNFWINGCTPEAVAKIIKEGKPEKGMTPFSNVMTQEQIAHLSTFILKSLQGSNPANGKAKQGTECK